MIFPSYIFLLVFLPVTLWLWYGIHAIRTRLLVLTLASYVFYGWWDYRFVTLMLVSTLVDYGCGRRIYEEIDPARKARWLHISLGCNLLLLGFFKYYDFFASSLNVALGAVGLDVSVKILNIVLPVGISFYTFQSMSYSIDIYTGQCRPTRDFIHFACYVALFPQLVAGPIVRYRDLERQLNTLEARDLDLGQICDGIWLFMSGLVKKIWIADALAPAVGYVFDSGQAPVFGSAWAGALCYTFQLYFDFSGYSDMARGLGKMLGFDFPLNFNIPYRSKNISEFWNRWHISLSHWLRDYLFIPLGGSRGTQMMTLRNLALTMFLGGLWHGAAWTFVVWGLYHGLMLVIRAVTAQLTDYRLPPVLATGVTFVAVVVGWVMFRAVSLGSMMDLLWVMAQADSGAGRAFMAVLGQVDLPFFSPSELKGLGYFTLAFVLAFIWPNGDDLPKPRGLVWAVALAIFAFVTILRLAAPTPFLYFQF